MIVRASASLKRKIKSGDLSIEVERTKVFRTEKLTVILNLYRL